MSEVEIFQSKYTAEEIEKIFDCSKENNEQIDLLTEQNTLLKKEITQLTEILEEISREEGDIS
jgi:hypothetical protein